MPRKKYWRKGIAHKEERIRKEFKKEDGSRLAVIDEISTVFGHFHQGHPQFLENSGAQCVANSCSAILYDRVKRISAWTSNDLDTVLISGDQLYSKVKPNLPGGQIHLLISDIPDVVDIHGHSFNVKAGESLSGYVLGTVHLDLQCDIFMSLRDAIQRTFSKFPSCIVTFKSSSFSVIKRDQYFYIVDPHSRDVEGAQIVDGTAVCTKYSGLDGVVQQCIRLAISLNAGEYEQFEITGIDAEMQGSVPLDDSGDFTDVAYVHSTHRSFAFNPLTDEDQSLLCETLGLQKLPSLAVLGSCSYLGDPCTTKRIEMDGNCFFRALSFAVSGTEDNHRRLRLLTVKHLLENPGLFTRYLRDGHATVERYVQSSRMRHMHIWATELEIIAAADLLQTDIYTYSGSWLLFSRTEARRRIINPTKAVHLHHVSGYHYDVVVCVRKQELDHCTGNCVLSSSPGNSALQNVRRVKCQEDKIIKDVTIDTPGSSKSKITFGQSVKRKLHRKYMHEKRLKTVAGHVVERNEPITVLEQTNKGRNTYATNASYRRRCLAGRTTKYANPVFRKLVNMKAKERYNSDELFQNRIKAYSKLKYLSDTSHKEKVKAYSKEKYLSDTSYKEKRKVYSKKKYMDDEFRKNKKSELKKKYSESELYRKCVKERQLSRRQQRKADLSCIDKVTSVFQNLITDAPHHICVVCHRRFFRRQVILCKRESYSHKSPGVKKLAAKCISTAYLHICSPDCEVPCIINLSPYSKLWICYTCHRKISSGVLPAGASVNSLQVEPVPHELSSLNQLEQHLIAKHIPFAKVAALPKGGQKSVHGPVVCVPSSIDKTIVSLPRPESEDQLIRVKLKRKLSYKGHYKYQFVKRARIEKALEYLKENNPHYQDVTFNSNWANDLSSSSAVVEKGSDSDSLPDVSNDERGSYNEGGKTDTRDDDARDEENLDMSHTGDQGLVIDSCLQPVDLGQEILDNFADNILCLAPAEGNDPIRVLMNEENEAKSFPVLFPKGSPTYHDDREEQITISRYLNSRLMHADCRFAKSSEYIFYAQYLAEVHQVLSSVSVALRKSHRPNTGETITSDKLTDFDSLRAILKSDSGFKFLKPVRGTPAYWQSTQKDLFAMLRQLGTPTWFCSFSAADMRWPEYIKALLVEEGRDINITDMEWSDKCELIRENPVMAARMFEHRFHCFLKEFLLSPANPIGKIVDYFYRVEFQHRGSPHTHCLFWVEGAPKLDHESDEEVTTFIDKYVTCEMPSSDDKELQEIVSSVQKHSSRHSKSCKKKGTNCRFNFPRPPSMCTFISRPSSSDVINECNEGTIQREMSSEEAKRILEALWKALSNQEYAFESVQDLFNAVGINQDQFEEAYRKLSKRASVVLKRDTDDVWINQYNPHLLRAWNGNIDVQFVLDAYSCIVYIISYISKSEREMGLLLEQARKETLNGNEDAKEAMKKLGAVYLHSREVSAQEAVFRVCNLHLKECSRFVQFIPVGDVIKMSLPLKLIQSKSSDGDLNVDDMWMTCITDRYKNRPDGDEFEAMCLARFCSEFRVLSKTETISRKAQNEGLVNKLKNHMGHIRRRTRSKPAVVRYPRFSPESQPEKFFQSILQLFLPYREDSQLKPDAFDSFEDFFETGAVSLLSDTVIELVKDIVNRNKALFETDADEIARAEEILEMGGHLEDAWAQICPETEAERITCSEEMGERAEDPYEEKDIPDLVRNKRQDYSVESEKDVLSGSEAKDLLRSLNQRQLDVFFKVRKWCLDKVHELETDPFYLFVTGGAGTGKTHLIRSLYYEANRLLARCLQNPDDTSVLITAPTGVAAFNIGASTIHSTFSIPVDMKLPYQPLGEEKLNTLRSKYGSLQILIVDEISMVDHKLLAYIHGRLRQIKQCQDYSPFGKVCVIAVGDFYQLPPVKGKPLYKDDIGFNLWYDNFKIVELTEVMRQKDQRFANTLNRLRTRRKTENISAADVSMLTERETGEETDDIHIFATNQQVTEFNLGKLSESEEDIIVIDAEDFEKDQRTGKLQKRDHQFISTMYSNLPRKLSLTVGARVLLTKNIDVSDGLVNGVFGTVSHIPCQVSSENEPNGIYVVFDSDRVGTKIRRESQIPCSIAPRSTPIYRTEDRVSARGGIRRQFPLKLSFACTIHKLQGVTLDRAVVSLDKIFVAGQAYVALSRVRLLEGLTIQNFKDSVIYCNDSITEGLLSMTPFLNCTPDNWDYQEPGLEEFKFILHNVQGLRSHIHDISKDKRFTTAHAICVTETWLSCGESGPDPHLEGFTLNHKTREESYDQSNALFKELKQQMHGGVGIFYQSNLKCKMLDLTVPNLESIAFYFSGKKIALIVIYRPVFYSVPIFIQNLDKLLKKVSSLPYGCAVVGDFNENIFKSNVISKLFNTYHFQQVVTEATTENGTLIDHVYVRHVDTRTVRVIPTYFSYHDAIVSILSPVVSRRRRN